MTRWHGGKGSTQRSTDKKKFDEGWDRIFSKKDKCNSCEKGYDGTNGNGYQPCTCKKDIDNTK